MRIFSCCQKYLCLASITRTRRFSINSAGDAQCLSILVVLRTCVSVFAKVKALEGFPPCKNQQTSAHFPRKYVPCLGGRCLPASRIKLSLAALDHGGRLVVVGATVERISMAKELAKSQWDEGK